MKSWQVPARHEGPVRPIRVVIVGGGNPIGTITLLTVGLAWKTIYSCASNLLGVLIGGRTDPASWRIMEDGVPEDFPRTAADTTRLAWTPDGGYLANLRTARTLPPCFSQSSVLQDIFRVKTNEGYALMVLPSKKGRIVLNGSSITDLIFLQETVA